MNVTTVAPNDDDEIERRLVGVSHRFGVHLDDAQATLVRHRIRSLLEARQRLRGIPLSNCDEPAPVFVVHQKEYS